MRALRAPLAVHRRPRRVLSVTAMSAVVVTLAAGCSSSGPSPTVAGPSAEAGVLPSGHVHAVAIDPGDGATLLATHEGLVEVGPGGELTPSGPVIDLMGFTVVGPDRHLASGHPGLRVDLPQPVGLIESTDGGRTWEQLTIPAEPHTLAAAADGATVLATTARGLFRSADAGGSWARVDGAPLLQVVTWAGDGSEVIGVDAAGTLWRSTDAGDTWEQGARLGSPPHAVTAAAEDGQLRVLVVTDDGLVESTDGGRTFTTLLSA